MVNFTSAPGNVIPMFFSTKKVDEVTRTVFLTMALLCFSFFFYFIAIMLKVFFTTPHMQEDPRYVLFVHMLINDTLNIILGYLMVVPFMYLVYIPVAICLIITSFAGYSFLVTPYNLALMSLERYIAICLPLRYLQFCTPTKAKYAIAVIWVIGLSLIIVNLTVGIYSVEITSYPLYVLCDGSMLMINPIQDVARTFTNILSFTVVALIIVYTYINVMLVARRIGSSGSSANKATTTVMLHAFQLVLCMVAFISTITETYIKNYMYHLILSNYILFVCLPRLLSPFIYGVRDEAFQKHIRKYCTIILVCRPQ